jgi:hypothetical protein
MRKITRNVGRQPASLATCSALCRHSAAVSSSNSCSSIIWGVGSPTSWLRLYLSRLKPNANDQELGPCQIPTRVLTDLAIAAIDHHKLKPWQIFCPIQTRIVELCCAATCRQALISVSNFPLGSRSITHRTIDPRHHHRFFVRRSTELRKPKIGSSRRRETRFQPWVKRSSAGRRHSNSPLPMPTKHLGMLDSFPIRLVDIVVRFVSNNPDQDRQTVDHPR